jgi:putative oxidoreductase
MPTIAAIGRVLIAALFIWSGYGKLGMAEGMQQYIAAHGVPLPPDIAYWGTLVVELGGGLLLLIGLQARIVAAALALFALVTAAYFHTNFAEQGQMVNFMKNIAIAGGLLQVVAFGAGRLSVDRA